MPWPPPSPPPTTATASAALGWVSDADRQALLAGAAVLAYPSRYEGFGLPPLEALAARDAGRGHHGQGRCPRSSATPPSGCEPADPDGLAAALATVLADPDRAGGASSPPATDRLAAYAWDRTADGVATLYRSAAAAR